MERLYTLNHLAIEKQINEHDVKTGDLPIIECELNILRYIKL